jgi:hypothetical protein
MALAKAQILLKHDPAPEKGFTPLFNPEEYTINQDNNFAAQAIPGLSAPLLQFVHGNMRTLEMELFFDTYEEKDNSKRDVRHVTNRFLKLMEIDSELHAPPVLVFSWASLQFDCVLARASQKYIMFLEDGRPVRARLTVTFNEYVDPEREAKKINRQTADFSKAHVVTQGETLMGIAAKFYRNPQQWRPIALANGLDDPRAIFAGQTLQIPSLPFVDQQTGEVLQ